MSEYEELCQYSGFITKCTLDPVLYDKNDFVTIVCIQSTLNWIIN